MKTFYAVLLVFVLILGGILLNAIEIQSIASETEQRIKALSEYPSEESALEIAKLQAAWKERTNLLGLSVSYSVIDRVSEQMQLLAAACSFGDVYGYVETRVLLLDAIEDFRRLERLEIANLF